MKDATPPVMPPRRGDHSHQHGHEGYPPTVRHDSDLTKPEQRRPKLSCLAYRGGESRPKNPPPKAPTASPGTRPTPTCKPVPQEPRMPPRREKRHIEAFKRTSAATKTGQPFAQSHVPSRPTWVGGVRAFACVLQARCCTIRRLGRQNRDPADQATDHDLLRPLLVVEHVREGLLQMSMWSPVAMPHGCERSSPAHQNTAHQVTSSPTGMTRPKLTSATWAGRGHPAPAAAARPERCGGFGHCPGGLHLGHQVRLHQVGPQRRPGHAKAASHRTDHTGATIMATQAISTATR